MNHRRPWRLMTTTRCSRAKDEDPWQERPGGAPGCPRFLFFFGGGFLVGEMPGNFQHVFSIITLRCMLSILGWTSTDGRYITLKGTLVDDLAIVERCASGQIQNKSQGCQLDCVVLALRSRSKTQQELRCSAQEHVDSWSNSYLHRVTSGHGIWAAYGSGRYGETSGERSMDWLRKDAGLCLPFDEVVPFCVPMNPHFVTGCGSLKKADVANIVNEVSAGDSWTAVNPSKLI